MSWKLGSFFQVTAVAASRGIFIAPILRFGEGLFGLATALELSKLCNRPEHARFDTPFVQLQTVQQPRSEFRVRRFAVLPHTASFLCDRNGGFNDIANCLGRKDIVEFVARDFNDRGQVIGLLMLEKQPNSLAVILEPIQ